MLETCFGRSYESLMYKLKKGILPLNFKHYTSIKNYNYFMRFSVANNYFPRVNSYYGSKSFSYLGCKIWEEI